VDGVIIYASSISYVVKTVQIPPLTPYAVNTVCMESAKQMDISVASSTEGRVRDCLLVVDCTKFNEGNPEMNWSENFYPATDHEADMKCSAGKINVFRIEEFARNRFMVFRSIIATAS
jgi:hypothetical protein